MAHLHGRTCEVHEPGRACRRNAQGRTNRCMCCRSAPPPSHTVLQDTSCTLPRHSNYRRQQDTPPHESIPILLDNSTPLHTARYRQAMQDRWCCRIDLADTVHCTLTPPVAPSYQSSPWRSRCTAPRRLPSTGPQDTGPRTGTSIPPDSRNLLHMQRWSGAHNTSTSLNQSQHASPSV